MSREADLYEKIWGEPAENSREVSTSEPSVADWSKDGEADLNLNRHSEPLEIDPSQNKNGDGPDTGILRRLEALEARIDQIQRTGAETKRALEEAVAQLSGSITNLQWSRVPELEDLRDQRMLMTLEALEARMARLEKGLVRSLEHLEARITGASRPKS